MTCVKSLNGRSQRTTLRAWYWCRCECSEIKGNPVNRNKHASVSTSLTSLWKHASEGLHLCKEAWPVCVWETSLPMQRSHWHLMSRHFCLRLVSGISTATTDSGHHIVWPTKTMEAPQRGYTLPKRWSRHIEITCSLHRMWLRHLRYPPGTIHTMNSWLALPGPTQ